MLAGFAGAAADAFALIERFKSKLKDYQGLVPRAAIELAREWRTDRMYKKIRSHVDCSRSGKCAFNQRQWRCNPAK